ncbi:MAG: hypothetical protein EHM48_02980 [Planctomycetaceae bacterium]|nr:MAG: hypothetical protein EHM48_02980 [Planctomycetaceae bacterium]
MAEWIIVALTALGTLGAIVTVLIKVSTALSRNTDAIDRLTGVMDKQDERIGKLDSAIDNHEGRIVAIETIHRVRGCDSELGQRGIE